MLERKGLLVFMAVCVLIGSSSVSGQDPLNTDEVKRHWNDFLHYATIGLIDIAKGHGEALVALDPDPIYLLELSEENPQAYKVLLRMQDHSEPLRDISGQVLDIIEKGRFLRRTEPKIILEEIDRLDTTIRGRLAAQQRLQNAGEWAVAFLVDVLLIPERKDEFVYITEALVKIGRGAIRPLAAALQTQDVGLKVQIIRVMGEIGYPQALSYLKYEHENTDSGPVRDAAEAAIERIDSSALQIPAAELFFRLGESYYYHSDAIAPAAGYDFANVWFWDRSQKRLTREEVDLALFHELMAMRCCENALRANMKTGKAIGLWLASYFKLESTGAPGPEYFGLGHADAMTYATTAGAEYLHMTLDRAITDENDYVALQAVEALSANAGQESLLYRLGTDQPLVKALSYNDISVRYSAAIAIGKALPDERFQGSSLIAGHLGAAITEAALDELGREKLDEYAMRSLKAMKLLAVSGNTVVELTDSRSELIGGTKDTREFVQTMSGEILAWMSSPACQRALYEMAMNETNSRQVRLSGFDSLAVSAKRNGSLLGEGQVRALYEYISSTGTDPEFRSAGAMAFGSLNLPSRMVKDLILDQAVQ